MRRNYQSGIKESEEELRVLEAQHRNTIISTRLRLLRLLKGGEARSVEQAAQAVHYSRRQAQRWLKRYYSSGLAALLEVPKKPTGASERMTATAWRALDEAMRAGEVATYGQVRQVVAEHGVFYKDDSSLLKLFKRHKIKAKTGRPRHEKADVAVQSEFKKTLPSV